MEESLLLAVRQYAIDAASRIIDIHLGESGDQLIEAARKIEAYLLGQDK